MRERECESGSGREREREERDTDRQTEKVRGREEESEVERWRKLVDAISSQLCKSIAVYLSIIACIRMQTQTVS